jgi:catechol 2,3-dioxygenase-like lactoylglutathione lyase family enzyme
MALHSIVVIVDDQDLALTFYEDVLGWAKREDNQMSPDYRFLVVVPPGHSTGVTLGPPHIHGRPAPGAATPADTGINLTSTDLLADYEAMVAAGVTFDGPPTPMPWGGYGARFCDPFGNRYFVTDGA